MTKISYESCTDSFDRVEVETDVGEGCVSIYTYVCTNTDGEGDIAAGQEPEYSNGFDEFALNEMAVETLVAQLNAWLNRRKQARGS